MFSALRKRITPAGTGIALALVLAMSGGAYAASKYVITSIKQIKPSVLKQLQKPGPQGQAGPAGPVGPVGSKGDAGTPGTNGKDGKEGAVGPTGEEGPAGAKGVAGATGPTGPAGATGSKGVTGTTGVEGSPWTAGGVLPSGKTETGVWGIAVTPGKFGISEYTIAGISFTIPLAKGEIKATVIAPGGKGAGGGCPTTSSLTKPEAEKGNLCIFQGLFEQNIGSMEAVNPENNEENQAGTTGALVHVEPKTTGSSLDAHGTWAVTAE